MTDVRAALQNPNVKAFLRVIRQGETNQSDVAYRMMFGGATFDDFGHHPNLVHTIGALKSTAAGAYQFLGSTWGACQRALDLPDFSPASQDLAAVWLISNRGALDDVIAGRIEQAIGKCAHEWASLPGSPYGQPTRTLSQALDTYAQWGGALGAAARVPDAQVATLPAQETTPSPAPAEAPPADVPADPAKGSSIMDTVNAVIDSPLTKFALAAVNPLLAAVPEFIHLFTDKATGQTVPERNVSAVTKIVAVAQQALQDAGHDVPNAQAVAELVTSDPAAKAVAREALMSAYYSIAVGEAGGGGIAGARTANAALMAPGSPGFWLNPAFIISVLLLLMPFGLLADVFYVHPTAYVGELRTQIVTGLLAIVFSVAGYWIGTSFSSAKKDDRPTSAQ